MKILVEDQPKTWELGWFIWWLLGLEVVGRKAQKREGKEFKSRERVLEREGEEMKLFSFLKEIRFYTSSPSFHVIPTWLTESQ